MYRPDGWENPHSQITHRVGNTVYGNFHPEHASIYEAGADDMLKALLKSNEPSCEVYYAKVTGLVEGQTAEFPIYGKTYPGKLVFIPEEVPNAAK